MNLEQRQIGALKALKAFNNAVTTSRLYPPMSPQVSNSVEKAYQTIKSFSRTFGELAFSKMASGPLLCGLKVDDEIAEEIKELVVYRHLDLLKLEHVALSPKFDRKQFSTILTVFSARKEKVNREGGGRPFVDGLGLDQFFPDTYQACELPAEIAKKPGVVVAVDPGDVPADLLDYLFGTNDRPELRAKLDQLVGNRQQAAQIVAAGSARAIKRLTGRLDEDVIVVSRGFTLFLDRLAAPLAVEAHEEVAAAAAQRLLSKSNEQALVLLLAQDYPAGFGLAFFDALVHATTNDMFDAIMADLRRRQAKIAQGEGQASGQGALAEATIEKLLATRKGKQFLGREKARSLLSSGEQDRKNRRIETGISALLSGSSERLRSEELIFSLPSRIDTFLQQGVDEAAGILIDRMAAEMVGGDDEQRQHLIQSLILVGEMLMDQERWNLLDKMTGALISWLRESEEGDFVYEKCVSLLQGIMNHAWESGNFSRGDQILPLFHKIRTGKLQKPPPILALIGRIQDRTFNRQLYESFIQKFLAGGGDTKSGERLSMLGRPAGYFMIEKLLEEEEPVDRLRIIELLTNMGPVLLAVILERLPEPMPWYGKRNLIKLATEVAGPQQVKAILPFLRHDDIRVQREAFVCIHTISREHRRQALLGCLPAASEILLPQVVKALRPYSDEEIARKCSGLLQDQENFSDAVRDQLVSEILKVLARSYSDVSRQALRTFLDNRNKKANRRLSEELWPQAENALRTVEAELKKSAGQAAITPEPDLPPEQRPAQPLKPLPDKLSEHALSPDLPVKEPPAGTGKKRYEQLPGAAAISELLNQGKKDLARESILKLITKAAERRHFSEAEALREWLMEFDPMALTEIIHAAEIIEEEKVASIDKDHIETWSGLYDALTTEEFATFFHAMQRKTYKNEEVIVNQGDIRSGMFFINSGKVKVFFRDKSGENLVKTAARGDILGADTVFDASVWTVGAACLSKAEVFFLSIKTVFKWRDDFPALESKLNDYCMKSASLENYFRGSGKDRRASKRHQLFGRVSSALLDGSGQDTGITSKGELSDISAGGVSFFLRISQKKNARLLLGRNIRLTLPMEGAVGKQFVREGTIIAVRGHQAMENEYSVHVQFVEDISPVDLQVLIQTGKEGGA